MLQFSIHGNENQRQSGIEANGPRTGKCLSAIAGRAF
jgi:hypothetical protein